MLSTVSTMDLVMDLNLFMVVDWLIVDASILHYTNNLVNIFLLDSDVFDEDRVSIQSRSIIDEVE